MARPIRSHLSISLNEINMYFCSVGVNAVAAVEIMSQLSLESLNDSILNLLKCPKCSQYVTAPIYMCKNGHNLCSECMQRVTECPTCSEICIDSQNILVEQIAKLLLYPCENFQRGCNVKKSLWDIVEHQNECPERLYECLPNKTDSCEWKGRRGDIWTHMMNTHVNKCLMLDDTQRIIYELNIFDGTEDIKLISACHEVFWYNFKCDPGKQKLFLAVQFIGPKKLASNFLYGFVLASESDEKRINVIRRRTHPDTEKACDIFASSVCVVVNFAELRYNVTNNNHLSFYLEVTDILPDL
jgi:hypothetical protein